MKKNKKYEEIIKELLNLVGGKDNVSFFTHCVTRLRFNVKDRGLVKEDEINKLNGVLGCQWSGEQFQVIIGQAVEDVYHKICETTGLEENRVEKDKLSKGFSIGAIFDTIAACLSPVIPVLVGTGMLKVVILLLQMSGLISMESSTYTVLSFVADAGFYFLPVFVGASSAKKFGGNIMLGMFIGAILIHPTFISLVAEDTSLSIFGLPIYEASYSSTVFPVIISVFVMSYIEKLIVKYSPETVRSITEP